MALLQMSKELEGNKCGIMGAVGGGQLWGGVGADVGVGDGLFYDQHDSGFYYDRNQIDGRYGYGQRTEEHSRFENYRFDGLALSDAFLANYYSQVSISFTQHNSS